MQVADKLDVAVEQQRYWTWESSPYFSRTRPSQFVSELYQEANMIALRSHVQRVGRTELRGVLAGHTAKTRAAPSAQFVRYAIDKYPPLDIRKGTVITERVNACLWIGGSL